jgi:hypothetical protein
MGPFTEWIHSETVFPVLSETGSRLGVSHMFDPLRIHTSIFYHLYLLAEAFGVGGSYVPHH